MRTLIKNEICSVAGGTTMDHVGKNIIITVPIEDYKNLQKEINFCGCYLGWAGPRNKDGDLIQQGAIYNGYHINYSMGSNTIAQYILTPTK